MRRARPNHNAMGYGIAVHPRLAPIKISVEDVRAFYRHDAADLAWVNNSSVGTAEAHFGSTGAQRDSSTSDGHKEGIHPLHHAFCSCEKGNSMDGPTSMHRPVCFALGNTPFSAASIADNLQCNPSGATVSVMRQFGLNGTLDAVYPQPDSTRSAGNCFLFHESIILLQSTISTQRNRLPCLRVPLLPCTKPKKAILSMFVTHAWFCR